jgi:hypothetical protein
VLDLSAAGVAGLQLHTADEGATTVQLEGSSNKLVPVVLRAPAAGLSPGLYDIHFQAVGQRADQQDTTVIEQSSFYVPR